MDYTKEEEGVIQKLKTDPRLFPYSVNPRLAQYLYRLVREIKPNIVFEIGCFFGYSTLHITKALKENGNGHLVAFDFKTRRASDTVQEAGLSEFVTFLQGDSSEIAKQYLSSRKDIQIDFIFLDGDHTRRGCAKDFNALLGNIREGGYFILHDIYPQKCGWKGPRMVMDYLTAAKSDPAFSHFTIEERSDLDTFGVALCQMTSRGKNPFLEGSWLKKMALRGKTSRVSMLFENIVYKARAAPNLGAFIRELKEILRDVYLIRLHRLRRSKSKSGQLDDSWALIGQPAFDPEIRISGTPGPGAIMTVEVLGKAGSRWVVAWSSEPGPHFISQTGITFDIGPDDVHIVKNIDDEPLYLDSFGHGKVDFRLPYDISAGLKYIQGVTEKSTYFDKTNRVTFEIS